MSPARKMLEEFNEISCHFWNFVREKIFVTSVGDLRGLMKSGEEMKNEWENLIEKLWISRNASAEIWWVLKLRSLNDAPFFESLKFRFCQSFSSALFTKKWLTLNSEPEKQLAFLSRIRASQDQSKLLQRDERKIFADFSKLNPSHGASYFIHLASAIWAHT